MKKYPVLRSGFLGVSLVGMKQPDSKYNAFNAAILGKQRLEPDNSNYYHEDIQKLFVRSQKEGQYGILNDFQFQEDILRSAAEAFGTTNFYDWLKIQLLNPEITGIQKAFLVETLEYLCGTPRKTHIHQWIRLLEYTGGKDRNAIRTTGANERIEEFIDKRLVPASLSEVFVRWIRQPGGFYEFISSMEAFFGNRKTLVN